MTCALRALYISLCCNTGYAVQFQNCCMPRSPPVCLPRRRYCIIKVAGSGHLPMKDFSAAAAYLLHTKYHMRAFAKYPRSGCKFFLLSRGYGFWFLWKSVFTINCVENEK
jgi:hypothetical protein